MKKCQVPWVDFLTHTVCCRALEVSQQVGIFTNFRVLSAFSYRLADWDDRRIGVSQRADYCYIPS